MMSSNSIADQTIPLKCLCGSVAGQIENFSKTRSERAICYCDDCQAYAHYLGKALQLLDVNGGTDIVPVRPAQLKITTGQNLLGCVRLSEKGMYRWFTECCRTPIANSMSGKVPFAGMPCLIIQVDPSHRDEVIGPIRAKFLGKYGIGPLPKDAYMSFPLNRMIPVMLFMLGGFLKGASQPSPFFDAEGNPVVKPKILSANERDHLRQFCGPKPASREL